MAQKRSITPEKQLLGLIENSKSKSASVGGKAIKYRSLSFLSISAWLARLSFFKGRFHKRLKLSGPAGLEIAVVNRVLAGLLAILMSYFAWSLIASFMGMKRFPEMALNPQENIKLSIFPDVISPKGAAYLDKIRQRDIFKMGAKPPERVEADKPKASQPKALEATQHLKLVGISWSSDPEAMIEDSQLMRTFFVKIGQSIGEVKIRSISKKEVILSYEGEEVELR